MATGRETTVPCGACQCHVMEPPMFGLMQNHPLLISSLIDFAERHHGEAEVGVAPRGG